MVDVEKVLTLNAPHEGNLYQSHYGKIQELRVKLREESRSPCSIANILKRRLEIMDKARFSVGVRYSWWCENFFSSDAMIYHPDGRAKIVLDFLSFLIPSERKNEGSLFLSLNMYAILKGKELSAEAVEKYHQGITFGYRDPSTGKYKTAREEPIWRFLAREKKLDVESSSLAQKDDTLIGPYEDLMSKLISGKEKLSDGFLDHEPFSAFGERYDHSPRYTNRLSLYLGKRAERSESANLEVLIWSIQGLQGRSTATAKNDFENEGYLISVPE